MDTLGELAEGYVAAGFVLVAFNQGTKGPTWRGWNLRQRCVDEPHVAAALDGMNIGLAHAYSRTAALDLDNMDLARAWFAERGVDLDALLAAPDAVMISSGREGRGKLLYRLPEGVEPLASKRMDKHGLELRCASTTGLTVQDVLPPSVHPDTGKPYVWAFGALGHWSTLPELPADVVTIWQDMLRVEEREAPPPAGMDTERLRGILSRVDPDMGYNDWVKVGMALHHETEGGSDGLALWDEWSAHGAAYKGTQDLEPHWNSFGNSPQPVTLGWLMSQAGGVDPDEFDDLTLLPEPPKKTRFEIVSLGDYSSGPPPSWFIKGVLSRAGLGILYGESGAGKSFAVFDMLCAIARGVPWNARRVKPGRVIYVCAEGQDGFRQRIRAYGQHYGVDMAALPIGVISDIPNLLHDAHHKVVAQRVNDWGGADLIVIDTLAQTTPGSNENSSEDMGKALGHCRMIHAATGAMVLLVHHAGKDVTKGARGWSGLKAAADTELEVTRDGNARWIRVSKQKDGMEGLSFPFRLQDVQLGVDEDGDPITSCVLEFVEDTQAPRTRMPKGIWKQQVWKSVLECCELSGEDAAIESVLRYAVERMPKEAGKKDRRWSEARRALDGLVADDWLVVHGNFLAIKGEV